MAISLQGLGACREVGRSSFLLDVGEKILLDRGIKLSSETTEYPSPIKVNLDAAIVSHAHLDHSGDLPHLFMQSNALCYMTQPTLDIAEILWHDTLKIAGYEGIDAHFSKNEIERTKKYSFPLIYRRRLEITHKCSLQFFDAGHILGAALTRLDFVGKSFLYTGDFNPIETRLHPSADVKGVGQVDFVLCESTYGDRDHEPRKIVEKRFIEAVKETLDNGGSVVLPAFAVDRSQEIVDVLIDNNIDAPIFFDGMCQKVSSVYMRYPEYLKDAKFLSNALKDVVWVRSHRDKKKVLEEPCVVVATAGMLAGGPVLEYVKRIQSDEKSAIFLTGFQVPQTPGEQLLSKGVITIDGEDFVPRCHVQQFDFSAHADLSSMLDAFKHWNPQKIILCHGDEPVILKFKEIIERELGIETVALKLDEKIELE